MKEKMLISMFLLFFCAVSVFSMGRTQHHSNRHNNVATHQGGGGTPEPATILLILGGAGAAFAVRKKIKDKK